MSQIVINGKKTFNGEIRSLQTKGQRVFINGKEIALEESPRINIQVTGNVEELKSEVCDSIIIQGNATNISTISGDVEVKNNVEGNVKTVSGDVEASVINGKVDTVSGDIILNKYN